MSSEEDRRWDMERDRAWVCGECGRDDDTCDCDDEPEQPILCSWHRGLVDAKRAILDLTAKEVDDLAASYAQFCDECEATRRWGMASSHPRPPPPSAHTSMTRGRWPRRPLAMG